MKKVIGYARVSTAEQANSGLSIEMQKSKITAYAELHEMELLEIIVDEGYSATTLKKRPGVQQVLKSAFGGEVEAVIIFKLDRMFRNTSDALATSSKLNKKEVALHSVSESLDTSSAMGKFFFTVLASIAEMERNLIAERTSAVLQHKKALGKVYNHPPYGYDADDGTLVENSTEQTVIFLMLAKREKNWSYQAIADLLINSGVQTKKKGGKWHASSVQRIIERVKKEKEDEI